MKIKVSEATNLQLDWMVAKALNIKVMQGNSGMLYSIDGHIPNVFSPTNYWAQGGPIIERENIGVVCQSTTATGKYRCAEFHNKDATYYCYGPTVLIAAMRCFVASKLGEEVEVPDELG